MSKAIIDQLAIARMQQGVTLQDVADELEINKRANGKY